MDRKINEFIGISESQNINFNKDIVMTDIEGNSKIMVKCYCTIVAGQSISYYMDVVEREAFARYKDTLQEEISKFKADAERIAKENNVPVI